MTTTAPAPARRLVPATPVPERVEGDERPDPDQLRAMEGDILQQLEAAAVRDRHTFEVKRSDKIAFRFTVQSLTQEEYFDCRNKALKKEKAKGYGNVGLPVDVDRAKLDSLLIAMATIPEDRERIWMNRAAWSRFNVAAPDGLVAKVLRAGEIEDVVAIIDELSGFNAGTVELVGNS
jgi:Phage XkdN-like tail assembly chaperone protein, TAC